MANKRFPDDAFFDFSSIEKQIAHIKQQKGLKQNELKQDDENGTLPNDVKEILENQLSILQEIQYLLTNIEKNSMKPRRTSLFSRTKSDKQ